MYIVFVFFTSPETATLPPPIKPATIVVINEYLRFIAMASCNEIARDLILNKVQYVFAGAREI
jgi:hypothetical protein